MSIISNIELNTELNKTLKIAMGYNMGLYDTLQSIGYKHTKYPKLGLSQLSLKYKFINWLYKPKFYTNIDELVKGSIKVIFEPYSVTILVHDKKDSTHQLNWADVIKYGRNVPNDEIINYIKQLERELKLKRLI
jgi:hypothetical protein